MRPPVAAVDGNSPLRGKEAARVYKYANAMRDTTGFKVTKEQIVNNFTSDGKLADTRWNQRHHVTPSHFNEQNRTYHQQFFDKDYKLTERQRIRELTQQKLMDPYDENEVKGTRIPEYSSVSRERDVYGELGWISNFNVKCSKNNAARHSTYKEFFDGPKNYHITFTNSTLTNSEFFRQNAPGNSVAYQRQISSAGFAKSRPGSQSQ